MQGMIHALCRGRSDTPIVLEFVLNRGEGVKSSSREIRDNIVHWIDGQSTLGGGHYSQKAPNESERVTYNRLQSVEYIIGIAEILGASEYELRGAIDGIANEGNAQRRCKILRDVFPWSDIARMADEVNAQGGALDCGVPGRRVSSPTYALQDIIEDGGFLEKDDLERILRTWEQKKNLIL